jgi:hypothetical protein
VGVTTGGGDVGDDVLQDAMWLGFEASVLRLGVNQGIEGGVPAPPRVKRAGWTARRLHDVNARRSKEADADPGPSARVAR